ncbi:hypothetical protein MTX78_09185 [Hymenobacter tibetensis]|uniref:DUF306 domain-containing protein n=1 Tax=Hymenobacter tibetensis TaxID=497967 RepID=A0ABY4D2J4_9BACT|nr:hypothetical protein [Hymenobacter tibetensis]UOG76758.1 hypothetical protein MTX78_09185 [Hymenobacter tibetensis]
MKSLIIAATLSLGSETMLAQQASLIGGSKDMLESNHLSDYEVVTKDYRQGFVVTDNAYCHYWDATGSFKDKNLSLEFNKKDICIAATNTCSYDDLKQMLEYMNSHFTRIDTSHWKTVDNQFLFTMDIQPSLNKVDIVTIAMPKPKPVVKKK